MTKKLLLFIVIVLAVIAKSSGAVFGSGGVKIGDLYYKLQGDSAVVYAKYGDDVDKAKAYYQKDSIIIPDSVTYNNKIYPVKSIYSYVFKNCDRIRTVKLNNIMTEIRWEVFFGCTHLYEIYLPNSINSISRNAFEECIALHKVISLSAIPPEIFQNTFDDFNESYATLFVPEESLNAYKTDQYWSEFNNIEPFKSDPLEDSFNFSQKSAIVNTHSNFTLPIMLDNKNDVASLEFDVVLPADVTLVGENPVISAGRGSELNISTTDIEDGTVHVVATGELASGKGQIASIALSTTKSDYYNVAFQNVKITTKAGTSITLDNEDLQFVANHKKGDYNEDGDVDIVDAQDLMEYVLNAN